MARMNLQKAQGQKLCGYMEARRVLAGRNEETGQWEYETLEIDIEDDHTYTQCRKSKKAHGPSVKHPIDDHEFGGPDNIIITVMPRCGGGCGRTIEKGEQYRFWAPRYGARHTRCMTCPAPSRSMLTNSEILSTAWDIADGKIEAEDQSDLESQRDELAERVGEIVEMIEEKLQNLESGFGHTDLPVYEELDERKSGYEDWQQTIEGVDFSSFEEADEDECAECGLGQEDHEEVIDAEGKVEADHEFEAGFDMDGAIEELESALGECPE